MLSNAELAVILSDARALISNEKDWCRGRYRIHWLLEGTPWFYGLGRHCAVGALKVVTRTQSTAFTEACRVCGGEGEILLTNDGDGHAAVLALFDRTIATLLSSEQISAGVAPTLDRALVS